MPIVIVTDPPTPHRCTQPNQTIAKVTTRLLHGHAGTTPAPGKKALIQPLDGHPTTGQHPVTRHAPNYCRRSHNNNTGSNKQTSGQSDEHTYKFKHSGGERLHHDKSGQAQGLALPSRSYELAAQSNVILFSGFMPHRLKDFHITKSLKLNRHFRAP